MLHHFETRVETIGSICRGIESFHDDKKTIHPGGVFGR